MSALPAVLIIDDDPDVLKASEWALRPLGHPLVTLSRPAEVSSVFAAREVGVVLLDLNFERGQTSGREGLGLISKLKQLDPEVVVVVITAHAGVGIAVDAMKLGATDFLTKPWTNERLSATTFNALSLHASRRAALRAQQQARELTVADEHTALLGRSPAMLHVLSLIERAAPTDANVLILGENGTGKELVARALHRASKRAAQALVSVDLGAVPASLFESELFGHKKGAFTDAKSDRIGRMPAADGSTLFLDEIGNLPLPLQPRLLSALEQRQVTPVGANVPVTMDVRVVSATNLSRDQLADEKQFRPDLLFRLNTVEIHVPPLRQRREDIGLLAAHFLEHYTRKYDKPRKPLSAAAMAALTACDWPGNVRALRHSIERAVILGQGPEYAEDDLALPLPSGAAPRPASEDLNLERRERELIERALKKHAWNISLTAKDLGLTRASLYRRMERHGL